MLLPGSLRGFTVDPALDTALASAINSWLEDTWLTKYRVGNRYVGSISVSVEDPVGAVREIEKWAGHPDFRQIAISHYGPRPFGHPMYDEIWAAAARHDLPVSIHFKGGATQPLGWTSTGPLQYFVEYHSLIAPMAYATHMASFICNGVLDRHPNLRFLFLEGGFLWHRPFIDRMQRHWDRTGQEFSTKKHPLDYVRDHFRFATQPIEENSVPHRIADLFEEADAENLLMFSSDYPHYDYDPPSKALPRGMSELARHKILAGNALDFFNLPKTRPADRLDRKEQNQ
jgi:predicted TIM-barrel fold metal-dependent hydrolase